MHLFKLGECVRASHGSLDRSDSNFQISLSHLANLQYRAFSINHQILVDAIIDLQSASFTVKEAGGTRPKSNCSKLC